MRDILIVDDSRAMRTFLRKAIALTSFSIDKVHEAADGAQALELLDRETVDLVFTDINMPVMDGAALVAELARRQLTPHIPVIVVSTDSSTARVEQILALGASAYITKPFSPELIERELDRIFPGESDAAA